MTIWILAVVLLASEAGLGVRQGAIRVVFALLGILVGALVATPLGRLLKPVLVAIGIKHPIIVWLAPPVIVFIIVLILFKVVGYAVHRKVEVYYKYKAGDLRLALWERMNSRVGLCLAIVNGLAYLVLISFVLYISSYWSVQLATAPTNPKSLKLLNRLGKDLEKTGMAAVGRSIDRMPALYYDTADTAGLLYNNPALKDRLYQYPPFIGLEERPEYQGLANDAGLAQAWQGQTAILQFIKMPTVHGLLNDQGVLTNFWSMIRTNLHDLDGYLITGKSARYDADTILGRWDFDVNGTINLIRRARPNIPSKEMAQIKNSISASYARTTFTVMTDHTSILKSFPHMKTTPGAPPTTEWLNVSGRWRNTDGRYGLSYNPEGTMQEAGVDIEGDRLVISGQGLELAFQRQE